MGDEELMQVAVAISAIGLVGVEETGDVAIELTALTKLAARFPDLSLVDLNRFLLQRAQGLIHILQPPCLGPLGDTLLSIQVRPREGHSITKPSRRTITIGLRAGDGVLPGDERRKKRYR